jgi:outer membrane lipoprotein carrier protein
VRVREARASRWRRARSAAAATALLLATALLPGRAARADVKVDDVLAKIDGAKASVESLAGEFTQKNKVKLFKQELTAQGKLYFKRPRQIRWEYTTPDPSTLILDGNRATLTTPGAAAQQFDLDKDATMRAIFDQLLTWLGPGSLAQARTEYEIGAGGTAAAPVVVLTPKPDRPVARAFARVELRVDGKSGLLRTIALVEKNGDQKEITFTRLQKNVALPADAFK